MLAQCEVGDPMDQEGTMQHGSWMIPEKRVLNAAQGSSALRSETVAQGRCAVGSGSNEGP